MFTKGRYQCIKLNVKSKSITLNLALEPKKFETNDYHVIDLSDNPKFEKLPMLFKVKDEATLGYALTLISEVMNKMGVQQGEIPNVDYRMPYESNTELLKRGLVKGIKATDADVRVVSDNDGASREELFLYDHEHAAHVEIHEEDSPINNIEDAATEKASSSESTPEISSEDTVIVGGNVVLIRYRSSFMSRFIQAEKDVQDYYTAIKNHINSYSGIKSRTSWNYETFSSGRNQCVRLNIKGRTLMVCLALDPKAYNINKYHFVDMSDDTKFDKVPMLLKIRSDRALKYALELIDELMKTLGITKGENQNVDYHKPYESNSSLAKRGLMKIILPAGVNINESTILKEENVDEMMDAHKQADDKESENIGGEPITEEKAEEIVADEVASDATDENEVSQEDDVEMDESIINNPSEEEDEAEEVLDDIHVFTDAQHADEMIDDYEAEHSIEIIKQARTGKIEEVNIDEICANFDDGAVVTIESLKAKKLISKSAGRVKVLAKGTMTKCLTVEADRFSLQAVKMITLAGGVAKRYN